MNDTTSPLPRLNTAGAVNYLLTRHGIPVAKSTLKQWAWRGGGPEFQKSGPHRLYTPQRLDVWAEQRLTPVVASTSELASLLTTGRGPVQGLERGPAHVVGVGSARGRHKQAPARSTPPPRARSLAGPNAQEEALEDKPRTLTQRNSGGRSGG
jgi:hypothetical protein